MNRSGRASGGEVVGQHLQQGRDGGDGERAEQEWIKGRRRAAAQGELLPLSADGARGVAAGVGADVGVGDGLGVGVGDGVVVGVAVGVGGGFGLGVGVGLAGFTPS